MHKLLDLVPESTLIDWSQRFVRARSEQTSLFESDPAVQAFISGVVHPLLEDLGYSGRFDAMGNLVIESGPRDAARSALLFTYVMTHPASSMADPFSGELMDGPSGGDGGREIWGRGIAEQKGALCAAIAAFVAASKIDPGSHRVLAVSAAGETGQHKAAAAILDVLPRVPQLGIVAIGTGGRICVANKGRLDVHIEVRGRTSHSSTPWAGIDAIAGAQVVLTKLAALDLGKARHPLLGDATLTATAIRSYPEATHTIQDCVQMTFDRRLLPGQQPDEALKQIQDALGDVAPWTVAVRGGALQYPAELPLDGELIRAARAGCERMGVTPPSTFASHGCVDAGFLIRHHCEAAMWGPGDQSMWHTADERLPVRDLTYAATAYFGTLLEFGRPTPA